MHCIYACSHTEHGSEQRIIFLLRSICLGAFVPTSSVKDNFRLDNWNYQEQKGLPWWPRGKESACNAGNAGNPGSIPAWADPLEEEMATHSVILPGESQGQSSLVGYSTKGSKALDTTEWQRTQEKVRDQKNQQRVKTKRSTGPPKNIGMIKYISKILNSL